MLLPLQLGNPIKIHEEFLSVEPICSYLNVLTTFTFGGCSEDLDTFRFFKPCAVPGSTLELQ